MGLRHVLGTAGVTSPVKSTSDGSFQNHRFPANRLQTPGASSQRGMELQYFGPLPASRRGARELSWGQGEVPLAQKSGAALVAGRRHCPTGASSRVSLEVQPTRER